MSRFLDNLYMSATSCIPALYGQTLYTLHRLQYESCNEARAPLKRITALLTTAMALLLLPVPALTDESTTLQAIMPGLRDNLVEITDGLLTDDLAVEIGAAARAGDKTAAIGGFQGMIDGCFGCHIVYKDRVASVLRAAEHREGT